MKLKIFIEKENKNKTIALKENSKILDILTELKINPVTIIAVKNNEVVTEHETVSKNDKLELLSVVSGG